MRVRPAEEADCPAILEMILELARFEKLEAEVGAGEADLRRHLFGERPTAGALIADVEGQPQGYAVFYSTFSTFAGRPGLYLEDLYVRPDFRGRGLGLALFSGVAAVAHGRGCPRLEWAVLDWNREAIGFYEKLGGTPLSDWTTYRLTESHLEALARGVDMIKP